MGEGRRCVCGRSSSSQHSPSFPPHPEAAHRPPRCCCAFLFPHSRQLNKLSPRAEDGHRSPNNNDKLDLIGLNKTFLHRTIFFLRLIKYSSRILEIREPCEGRREQRWRAAAFTLINTSLLNPCCAPLFVQSAGRHNGI